MGASLSAWLGQNVVILPGVSIGQHCVVGANSVVNASIMTFQSPPARRPKLSRSTKLRTHEVLVGITHKASVIGTGSIGYRHMQVLRSLGVPVIAVPIREGRRLDLESDGWPVAGSLSEARQAGATFAVIATDTRRHVADAEEALRAGLHVLVEKPMAVSASEAKHLPRLAAERSLGLFIGCNLRFNPGLATLRQRLGEIGAVHAARIECRSYLPDWRPNRDYRESYSACADEGGVLRDLIHEIDYALWLFGVPERVCGTFQNFSRLGIQSEEAAEGQWVSSSGALVSIGLDYLSRHATRFVRAYGDKGEIAYDFSAQRLSLQKQGAQPQETIFASDSNGTYVLQIKEFLNIVSGGSPSYIASAEEGVNGLAVCDAWRRSAMTHRAEQVSL